MVESQTIVWLVAIQHEVTTKSSRAIKILYKKIITKSRNKVRTNPAGSSNAPLNIRSYSFSQDRAKPTLERTKSSSKPCHSTRVFVETTGITSGLWRSSQRGNATKQRILNPTVSHFKVAQRTFAPSPRLRGRPSGSVPSLRVLYGCACGGLRPFASTSQLCQLSSFILQIYRVSFSVRPLGSQLSAQ